jgi:hypothetical protein
MASSPSEGRAATIVMRRQPASRRLAGEARRRRTLTGQRSLRERFLADEGVRILPGTVVEASGWFRISLTATDDMVERGLGGFERARGRAADR